MYDAVFSNGLFGAETNPIKCMAGMLLSLNI